MHALLLTLWLCFSCFGAALNAHAAEHPPLVDLRFVQRISPEGVRAYVGKVRRIEQPWLAWFSKRGEMDVDLAIEQHLAGQGKNPASGITLRGRYPDLVLNQKYIIIQSPPDIVLGIVPVTNDSVIEQAKAAIRYEIGRGSVLLQLQTYIYEKLNVSWAECRVYELDRPRYREVLGTQYLTRQGQVQFIHGSINQPQQPSITFDPFALPPNEDGLVTFSGIIQPENRYFQIKVQLKEGWPLFQEFTLH